MKDFLKAHGHGFWLHMLGAGAIMVLGGRVGYLPQALVFNTTLWPTRELWQKRHALRDFFTAHVFIEWFPAVAIGAIMYSAMT